MVKLLYNRFSSLPGIIFGMIDVVLAMLFWIAFDNVAMLATLLTYTSIVYGLAYVDYTHMPVNEQTPPIVFVRIGGIVLLVALVICLIIAIGGNLGRV